MKTKICSKYKIEKSIDEFYRLPPSKGEGINTQCKKCVLKNHKEWQKNNPEIVSKSKRKYEKNNPEKVKDSRKKYYENNTEKIKEKNKKRLKDNPGIDKETASRWRKNNSDKVIELDRRWNKNNPEKKAAIQKAAKLKSVSNAGDSYLKDQIRKKYGIPIKMVTKKMILIERISLLLRRLTAGRGENTKELLIQTVQQYKKERVML